MKKNILLMIFVLISFVFFGMGADVAFGWVNLGDNFATCFSAGTKVNTPDGRSNIEDIKVGDKVISQDEDGERSVSTVTKLDQPIREHMCRLDFGNGTKVKLTEEHPLMTKDGWKALDPNKTKSENPNLIVEKLQVGDVVVRNDGEATLEKISCWSERTPAYNLILDDGAHTYFADGFLAHNKDIVIEVPDSDGVVTIGHVWTCFSAGTKVNTPDGRSNIEDIKVGDKVISQDEDGERSVSTVTKLDQPIREHMCRLDFGNGTKVKLTEEHPLMTKDGWKALDPNKTKSEKPNLIVEKLQVGDVVVRNDGEATLEKISCWSERTPAYNLILDDGAHTYFADGFLAHNKGGEGEGCTPNWTAWTPESWCGYVTQSRTDGCGNTEYQTSYCTECGPYISDWSACDANHKRSRTCTTNCGNTSLCNGVSLQEDCMAEIRGTIFDASDLVSCPSFDPLTGYLVGLNVDLLLKNRTFGLADVNGTLPHPWPILNPPVKTNGGGNYMASVYAPAVYGYDFSGLKDVYIVSDGPKLICTAPQAVVPSNTTTCNSQPCTVLKNMSFGFLRRPQGWWQVKGASVHGEGGVMSEIPSTLLTEQSLILPDDSVSKKLGVLSYGERVEDMLGINRSAKVSSKGWETKSNYEGVVYDWGFFYQNFKKHSVTDWDGFSSLVYNDEGRGYQIFSVDGNLDSLNYSPVGTDKIIFLVKGDVFIKNDIVVPPGAFLAVIASGNITFDTNVSRVDGWYVGSNLNVPCRDDNGDGDCDKTDVRFLGNGSFVGWSGVDLRRDRGDTNKTESSALFTYRRDLYDNAPDPMKVLTKTFVPFVP